MNYKIFIDVVDQNETSKNISQDLYEKLKTKNLNAVLLGNDLTLNQKIDQINNTTDEVIVISNQMNNANTSEIIYSLYFDDTLPGLIDSSLSSILDIVKYYQLRLPSDTSKDYYEIIRETPNAESIIIRYQNNINSYTNDIATSLADIIAGYIMKDNVYIVKKGDTIYSIARAYGITASDIINANNLANYNLSIGQELMIPQQSTVIPDEVNRYTVKSGDSLYKIANNFNTTVDAIKSLNNLTSNNLSIGQILLIPSTSNNQQYTVKSGDSLYKIANNFNTTVDAIKSLNNLTSNNLSIGQILLIPSNDSNTSNDQQYTVKSGDSLYKIANNFNTTVDAIKSLNNLTSNNLSIGQILLIPN